MCREMKLWYATANLWPCIRNPSDNATHPTEALRPVDAVLAIDVVRGDKHLELHPWPERGNCCEVDIGVPIIQPFSQGFNYG